LLLYRAKKKQKWKTNVWKL
jgi:hypothetical protein